MEFRVTTGLPVEGYTPPPENIQVFKKMGLGSFVKKIVKAPVKAVKAVGKGVAPLGSAIIDTGSKAVRGTAQVPEDIYSGVKKGVGSVSRGVEKVGSATVEGATGLLSDPLILGAGIAGYTGAIPQSQAFAVGAGSLALKSLGSSGAFVSHITPDQLAPPSLILGYLPTRIVHASIILFGISLASLTHIPVSSRERSFFTSSGLSNAKKITSRSRSFTFM